MFRARRAMAVAAVEDLGAAELGNLVIQGGVPAGLGLGLRVRA